MTTNKKFKRDVRTRMAMTGESYTAAYHALERERIEALPVRLESYVRDGKIDGLQDALRDYINPEEKTDEDPNE